MRFWTLWMLVACGEGSPAGPTAPPPIPVKVEVVAPAPLDRVITATGSVEAVESAEIRAEIQGLVEDVLFEDGAQVQKGQPLIRLRAADARAAVLDAEARAQLATVDLERSKTLFERGDVARADLDRAVAADSLAKAALQRARETLRRTTVQAPFDGVLGRREVSPGELIDPARTITRIESLSRLVVEVAFGESELDKLRAGQTATVVADALVGQEFPGTVSFVAPRVREDTRTVDVRVSIVDPELRLRPGLTATVRIVSSSVPDALLVPSEAVVRSDAGPAVYVVKDEAGTQKADLRPIGVGERTTSRLEVTSGLAVGDAVIVEGLARMRPGAVLAVQEGQPKAEGSGAPATAERTP